MSLNLEYNYINIYWNFIGILFLIELLSFNHNKLKEMLKLKRKIVISFIAIILIIAGSYLLLTYSKSNFDSIAKRLLKSNPTATIQNIDTVDSVIKPSRIMLLNIEDEKIFLYEFKDRISTEKAMPILTDGAPGENFILDSKGNIVIKYIGSNEKIIKQFKGLLH